jgi:hypothetical protein
MYKASNAYGSVKYYTQAFSDIVAEVEEDEKMDNVVAGFFAAIDDWENYHIEAASRYGSFRERIRKA